MPPGARPSARARRLSQVFLTDGRVADRMVAAADLRPQDTVLEIGPGRGVLTERLAGRAARVVAIEVDPALAASLTDRFRGEPTVEVVRGDATRVPWPDFTRVVASLPYHLSSELTFRILQGVRGAVAVVLLQEEFARRVAAGAGSGEYGRLSVMAALSASAEIVGRVGRGAFRPVPEVDSAILRLRLGPPTFPVGDRAFLADLVRVLFSHRRKKVATSFRGSAPALGIPAAAVADALRHCPAPDSRPEELEPGAIAGWALAVEHLRRAAPR